jgi:hypothetical protein
VCFPPGLQHKLYADDLKLYGPSGDVTARALLQSGVDAVSTWCEANDMVISIQKCLTLCSHQQSHVYTLNGIAIPVVNSARDLGITMTPELDFDLHINQLLRSASIATSLIFRCFLIKSPEFYINIYRSLVIPKFLYCSEVWRPYMRKHVEAIERVQRRFLRRVAFRCGIDRASLFLPPISELHSRADRRMYKRLLRTGDISHFVNVRENALRSGQTITAIEVARTERLNNIFAWRIVRALRSDPPD